MLNTDREQGLNRDIFRMMAFLIENEIWSEKEQVSMKEKYEK